MPPLFFRISGLDKLSAGWSGPVLAKAVPFWQTCDSQGAASIFYPFYLDFGREV
ncbi:MAG: hypothetical protein JSU73_13750 [candidate division WOR-3 bacterium]|nr:MAG: hypothetical protein JSU73_13750 [candidate division WOR-3 bacterium]